MEKSSLEERIQKSESVKEITEKVDEIIQKFPSLSVNEKNKNLSDIISDLAFLKNLGEIRPLELCCKALVEHKIVKRETLNKSIEPLISKDQVKPHKTTASIYSWPNGDIAEVIYNPLMSPSFQWVIYRSESDTIDYAPKIQLKNCELYPKESEMVKKGVVLLSSEIEDYPDETKLTGDIQNFIHKYVDTEPLPEQLATYYILLTYIFHSFDVVPYLRIIGDIGTGKTRSLKTVGSLCYKAIICGGSVTASPIFRLIDKFHGTLVIDEADFKNSEDYEDIIKVLNCGYTKGMPVIRTEKIRDTLEPQAYNCFSPKIIATRHRWKDKALESRCITVPARGRKRLEVPININHKIFDQEALTLRNQLLLWGVRHRGKLQIDEKTIDNSIEDRLNQIAMPLLSVIKDNTVRKKIGEFMRDYNQEIIEERGMTLEADILHAIIKLQSGNSPIRIKYIAEEVNKNLGSEKEDKISPRKVGSIIGNTFGFRKKRTRDGGVISPTPAEINNLKVKYGVDDTQENKSVNV